MEQHRNVRKWTIYSAVFFISITTMVVIVFSGNRFSAFKDFGSSGGEVCAFTATGIKVMDDWQRNGIMDICEQEKFINTADDFQYSYSKNPSNSKTISKFKEAIDNLLSDTGYKGAAISGDLNEMRAIEEEILSPVVNDVLPFIGGVKEIFIESGGNKISLLPKMEIFIDTAHAKCFTETSDNEELTIGDDNRDCWKPLKWPKGWETGPSPLGIPGWGGLRNPGDLPGWEFGGGPIGDGEGGFISPPGGNGWGFGFGTDIGGKPWVGIGGGNENGGGFIGLGGGGSIVFGGGIRF